MGLYIKGMEMPTERESFNLTIKYNGTVLDTETGMQVAEVYELPPHGNLKDADAIRKDWLENYRYALTRSILDSFDDAPTIIPAEEGE